MSRMVHWLLHREHQLFYIVNRTLRHSVLDFVYARLTHLGGATFTIAASILLVLLGDGKWSEAGWECLIALSVSHIPVAVVKRKYPRRRPYLVLPETNICKNPLTDHSFPSGHTTAIFAFIVPIIAAAPVLGFVLIPVAAMVGMSRIYLGLHYPSDCAAGCILGLLTGLATVAISV